MVWPWVATVAALALAVVWMDAARRIVRLRTELLHVEPPMESEAGREISLPLGDRVVRVRYQGLKVRRWDRLPESDRRRLILRHGVAGWGAAVLGAVGLFGLLLS